MNKFLLYYSIIFTALGSGLCLFDPQGESGTFFGGLIFLPIVYFLIMLAIEEKQKGKDETRDNLKKEIIEELKDN